MSVIKRWLQRSLWLSLGAVIAVLGLYILRSTAMPELDYWHIRKKYPDLFEGAIEDKKRALQRFMRSPESEPYKVRA